MNKSQAAIWTLFKEAFKDVKTVKSVDSNASKIKQTEIIEKTTVDEINLGSGSINVNITLKENLFYKVLTEITGVDVANEADLFTTISNLSPTAL